MDRKTLCCLPNPPQPPADPTLLYADGSEVSDNDTEIQAHTAYFTAEHKPPPPTSTPSASGSSTSPHQEANAHRLFGDILAPVLTTVPSSSLRAR